MSKLYGKTCEKCGSTDTYLLETDQYKEIFCNKCWHSEKLYISDELKAEWQAQAEEKNRQKSCKPKCPICGSTDLKKITTSKRVFKTALFGLAGAVDDAGKTYQCGKCKAKF